MDLSEYVTPILIVANSATLGGASLSLLELLSCLPQAGYRATVVAAAAGPFTNEAAWAGAEVRVNSQPPWVSPGTVDDWLYAVRQIPCVVREIGKVIAEIQPGLGKITPRSLGGF